MQVLFDELKLDQRLLHKAKIAKTNSGKQKSTSESVLLQLKGTHPLPDIILEHRQVHISATNDSKSFTRIEF